MATLQVIWHTSQARESIDELWSWNCGKEHRAARIIRSYSDRIHVAHIGPRNGQPSPGIVLLKTAEGEEQVGGLSREAEMYTGPLRYLQGSVVPVYYGFFRGRRPHGVELGCLVLEHCSGSDLVQDIQEFNRRVLQAACRLHEAGVFHGDLFPGDHFIKHDGGVRIIDFSTAIMHRCSGTKRSSTLGGSEQIGQCRELADIERIFCYRSRGGEVRREITQRYH